MLSLPLLLIGGLLVLAAVTYLLRTWDRAVALVAAALLGVTALALWFMDLSVPVQTLPLVGRSVGLLAPLERLGFAMQLQAATAPVLAACFALTAVAFALAARVSQGHTFVPIALVLLAGYTGVITMVSAPLPPLLMAPLFLVGLSCVSAFILQAGRLQHPAGPLRLIVPPVLAFPLFVLAAWYLDQAPLNPQDTSMQVAAAQLIMLGMVLLLAPVPLHGAQPAAMQSAPPVVAALVLLLYQFTVVNLFFRLQSDYLFLTAYAPLATWFSLAGAATAVWGGIAAAGTNQAGRLWGYAALHDWGLLIMVMGIPGLPTLPLALFLLNLRAISMMTTAAGLSVLEQHAGGLEPRRLQGAGTRLPWNSAAVLLGGLGLAGFPLSAGFTGHWAAIQVIAGVNWRPAVIVLLASGGAIFGYIRLARVLFGPLENRALVRERPLSAFVAVAALLLAVGLAVAPQLLDQPIARALLGFGS
ncbi:MAG: hypothetical protein KDE20_13500 [Caldilineaceae bacterium]|nr:hypothetical protein [Caldilineaceae bacterium]